MRQEPEAVALDAALFGDALLLGLDELLDRLPLALQLHAALQVFGKAALLHHTFLALSEFVHIVSRQTNRKKTSFTSPYQVSRQIHVKKTSSLNSVESEPPVA